MTALAEIEEKALTLPPDERERLAGALLHSLADEPLSEIECAWLDVAEERYTAYKAGKRQGIPGDQVFKQKAS
ncbi:MAG: addiction module protein [Acidobacteriota bacterium]|nr:addiction module protein [Acidobacteriota bacterium]